MAAKLNDDDGKDFVAMKNVELRANLLKLMTEHPDLPVIAMTDSDVVADDTYAWWWASIGASGITKVACWEKPDGETEWYEEFDRAVEDMMDYYADEDDMTILSEDQYEAFIREKVKKLNWRDAIYVDIVSFEPEDISEE